MDRRTVLICGLASVLPAVSYAAAAQILTRPPRVVMILGGTEVTTRPFTEAFLDGIARHDTSRDGRSKSTFITVTCPRAGADSWKCRGIVGRARCRRVTAVWHARDTTATVPVVVATSSALVDAGIVKSLAHPGGNITGVSDLSDEATVKRLELLRVALPNVSRVVLLVNPEFPSTSTIEARVQAAVRHCAWA